jgi:hypothetical protein
VECLVHHEVWQSDNITGPRYGTENIAGVRARLCKTQRWLDHCPSRKNDLVTKLYCQQQRGREKHEASMMDCVNTRKGKHSISIFYSYQEDLQSLLAEVDCMSTAHVTPGPP